MKQNILIIIFLILHFLACSQNQTSESELYFKPNLIEFTFGIDGGQVSNELDVLYQDYYFSSTILGGSPAYFGGFSHDNFTIYGRWICFTIGAQLPIFHFKKWETGLGAYSGLGNQRQMSISVDDYTINDTYDGFIDSKYRDLRGDIFLNYYFTSNIRAMLRMGIKYTKTSDTFISPNLELGITIFQLEVGISAQFLKQTYYRQYSTGETEPAQIISYPAGVYIRGLLPVKKIIKVQNK